MASDRATLKVAARTEFGSRRSRRLRRSGLVPGVVYADGGAARPFQVSERELHTFLADGHALFDLEIEGSEAVPVVVKEDQRHPVRSEIVHVDCHEVRLDTAIQASVVVELEGTEDAPGVKEGGVLEHITREVTIEALPTDIPDRLVADVSEMSIGDTIQLSAIKPPEGVTLAVDDPDELTIATLTPPRVEEEPEEVEEETELIGEDGEPIEAEEAPEGEAEGEDAKPEGEAEGSGGEAA
jgi:large subunit ribosomal protein L25